MGTAIAKDWATEIQNEQLEIPEGPILKEDTSALGTRDLGNTNTQAGKIQAMYPEIHENNYIDNSAIAVGSLPRDWNKTVQVYAKSKFPNIPIDEAVSRFGMLNGRVYYLGNDQKLYYATPDFSAVMNNPLENVDEWALRGTGPSIPIATGTAGAILSGGQPVVAGGAGMGGEIIRQTLAKKLTDEEMPIGTRAINVGLSGAVEFGGTVGGNLLNNAITKVITKLPDRLGKLNIAERFNTFSTKTKDKMIELSEKYGIRLTQAELSEDPTLIGLQKILANNPNSDQIIQTFKSIRNEDVKNAIYKIFSQISNKDIAPELAFKEGIKSSRKILSKENQILFDRAKAYYQEAFKVNNVNINSTIGLIDELMKTAKGNTLAKLQNVRSMLFNEVSDLQGDAIIVPNSSLKSLDMVKKEIDQIISTAGSTQGSVAKGNVVVFNQIKENLLKNMDNASSDYAKARNIYIEGMPAINQVNKGLLNNIAKQNEFNFSNIGNTLFNSTRSSVTDVRNTKALFFQNGMEKEWNQIVRGHLENTFDTILKEGADTNIAGQFYKKLFSSKRQKDILLEAFDGQFGRDFAELMQLFNQTTKAIDSGPDTAWKLKALEQFDNYNKPILASVLENIAIWNSPKNVANWWAEVKSKKSASRLAYLLTSQEGKQLIKELRKLPKSGEAVVMAFTHILNGGTFTNIREDAPDDYTPESINMDNKSQKNNEGNY
tara:strand:+ start:5596 stop:7743 length:2148 start_codon:yes stop_codon:yes gene_type:complete